VSDLHPNVTLCCDMLFILDPWANFLGLNIEVDKLLVTRAMVGKGTNELNSCVTKDMKLYTGRGFKVQAVHGVGDYECLRPKLPHGTQLSVCAPEVT